MFSLAQRHPFPYVSEPADVHRASPARYMPGGALRTFGSGTALPIDSVLVSQATRVSSTLIHIYLELTLLALVQLLYALTLALASRHASHAVRGTDEVLGSSGLLPFLFFPPPPEVAATLSVAIMVDN